jgi:hypothetical protein
VFIAGRLPKGGGLWMQTGSLPGKPNLASQKNKDRTAKTVRPEISMADFI